MCWQIVSCSGLSSQKLQLDGGTILGRGNSDVVMRFVMRQIQEFEPPPSPLSPPHYGCKPFVSYSLNQFFIWSIPHDFLDHFCPCVTTLWTTFLHSTQPSQSLFFRYRFPRTYFNIDRDPLASFCVAQQWFRPKILGLRVARILQS